MASVGIIIMGSRNPNITKDIPDFHQRGTSPLNAWYSSFSVGATLSNSSQAVDLIRSLPFISGCGGFIDSISFEIVTPGAGGAKGRVGIYEATSDTNLYPNNLVVDSGEFDCSIGGIKTASVNVFLKPNTLYWFAQLLGTNASTPRVSSTSGIPNVFGFANTLGVNPRAGFTKAQAYGALPDPYPSASGFGTGSTTHVWVHFT